MSQSEGSIFWQQSAGKLGDIPNSWVLSDQDVAQLSLPGAHVRRNASLVIKAFERIGISGDIEQALNHFPGVDRRFEKITDGIYSDYAVHPTEIAATIELAHEINQNVIVVYQPHQNVRQHAVKNLYTDCFELAKEIYWLPTYLTREDSSLEVLTPEQLAANVTNHDSIHFAELNDTLWDAVSSARKHGALVLFMGAGTIDSWLRQKIAENN